MKNPGFPFCLPRMAPLYTREPPSPRDCVRRTIVQVRRPSLQPTLTCSELEVRAGTLARIRVRAAAPAKGRRVGTPVV